MSRTAERLSARAVMRILAAPFTCLCLGIGFAGTTKAAVPAPVDAPYPGTIAIKVDATDTSQRIFWVHETLPVRAGTLTLL
ncbi:MAG: peptidase M61, partial [Steroidobacteraceae bacterium]